MNTTIWSALAEPNRLHIVELLREGAFTVGEIADRLQRGRFRFATSISVRAGYGISASSV